MKHFAAGAAFVALAMPLVLFAQTTTPQSQIQSLLDQIHALQQQLMTLVASTGAQGGFGMMGSTTLPFSMGGQLPPGQVAKAACISLNRNLGPGARGDDVKKLQELLAADPENEFRGSATGFFGPMTTRAMMKFQMRFGIASSTTGSVGPMTRGFFERACGRGLGRDDGQRAPEAGKIMGTVSAVASSSITVTPRGGQPRVVNITASTTIQIFATATSSPTTGTMTSLTLGASVAAEGQPNADGSLTATHVRVGVFPPPAPVQRMMEDRWNPKDFMENIKQMMKPMMGGERNGKGKGNDRDGNDD